VPCKGQETVVRRLTDNAPGMRDVRSPTLKRSYCFELWDARSARRRPDSIPHMRDRSLSGDPYSGGVAPYALTYAFRYPVKPRQRRHDVAHGLRRGIVEGEEMHEPRQWRHKKSRPVGDYVAPCGA
jgi:hypothetical protein